MALLLVIRRIYLRTLCCDWVVSGHRDIYKAGGVYLHTRQLVLVPECTVGTNPREGPPLIGVADFLTYVELLTVVRVSREAWSAVCQVVAQRAFHCVGETHAYINDTARICHNRVLFPLVTNYHDNNNIITNVLVTVNLIVSYGECHGNADSRNVQCRKRIRAII